MLYVIYLCGYALGKMLPIKVCYKIASFAATLYYKMAKRDRNILRENVSVILGPSAASSEVDQHTLQILKNFAKYLADFFKMGGASKDAILGPVKVEGRHYLDKVLSSGKGAIIFTAHLGNWELGGAVVSALGYKVNAIVMEHKDKRINALFKSNRESNGVNGIPLGLSVKGCFKALKNKEILAIVGDKDYTGGGVTVDFFGKKAVMPKGPAVLSVKTRAPIVPCFVIRQPDDTFVVEFDRPIDLERSDDPGKDTDDLMRACISVLEKYVSAYPDQWYVFEKIWQS